MHCCSASCLSAPCLRPPTLCFAFLLYASPSRSWSYPLLALPNHITAYLFLRITSPCRTPPWPRFLRRSIAINSRLFRFRAHVTSLFTTVALQILSKPPRCRSIHGLYCSTQSAALPFSSMSYLHYAVTMLIGLYYASAYYSSHILCLAIPFFSSAQLRYPCFSFARLCDSLAHLLVASP